MARRRPRGVSLRTTLQGYDRTDVSQTPFKPEHRPFSRISGQVGVSMHTKQLRVSLLARDGIACWICEEEMHIDDVTVDHIHPVSLGGESTLDNLKLAHTRCNGFRSSKVHLTPQELVRQMNDRRIKAQYADRHNYICNLYKELALRYKTSREAANAFRSMYGDEIACAPMYA